MAANEGTIKAKSICIFENDGFLFVSKAHDHNKNSYFYRPIGGTIEYREYSIDTVKREVKEELNTEIDVINLQGILENMFVYNGKKCHEIVFVYKGNFLDKTYYEHKEYDVVETDGSKIPGLWINVNEFINKQKELVPVGIIKYLQ